MNSIRALSSVRAWAALAGISLVLVSGCAAPRASSVSPAPNNANAELMAYIGDQPFVTADAGYRATYVLWKGQPFDGEFAALRTAMVDGGLAAPGWNHDGAEYLDRAATGHLICRACGISSGLNWMLTGLGRYAWKELQYRRIAQPSGEMGLISGGEFLGVLSKAEDYARTATDASLGKRAELGAQPSASMER